MARVRLTQRCRVRLPDGTLDGERDAGSVLDLHTTDLDQVLGEDLAEPVPARTPCEANLPLGTKLERVSTPEEEETMDQTEYENKADQDRGEDKTTDADEA